MSKTRKTPPDLLNLYPTVSDKLSRFQFLSAVVKICYEETAKYILVWIFHDKTIHDLARGIIVRVLKWAVILLMILLIK